MWRKEKKEEKKKERKRKVMSSTSNVYMNWLKLNMKILSIICSHAKQWRLQATFILQKTQLHLTPACSGLVLQADQQAPKGCHQLQGTRSCSDFHAGTLSALLQMKPCRLEVEPRFNRANKWNHSTSCSPQHITFRDSNQSWRKWKNKM